MTATLRVPLSVALAVLVNVLLFVFVIRLVTGERERLDAARDDISVIDFVRLHSETEPPTRIVRPQLPPPPPEPVKPPPPPREPLPDPPESPPPMRVLTPDLAPPLSLTKAPELPAAAPPPTAGATLVDAPLAVQETIAPPTAAPVSVEPQFDENLVPVYKPDPRYPPRALRAGIEGVVTVEFLVTAQGAVEDVKVVKAEPAEVFDDAARQGVSRWKFQPKVADGKPIARKARLDISFKLRQ